MSPWSLPTQEGTNIPYQNNWEAAYNGSSSAVQEAQAKNNYSNWNGDWLGYLTFMAEKGDSASQDKLFNYLMSEASADKARQWTADREDTQIQRWVADAKAGGINPYALLARAAGTPVSSSSSGIGYSGTQYTTQRHQEQTEAQGWLKSLVAMIPMIITIAAAAL